MCYGYGCPMEDRNGNCTDRIPRYCETHQTLICQNCYEVFDVEIDAEEWFCPNCDVNAKEEE